MRPAARIAHCLAATAVLAAIAGAPVGTWAGAAAAPAGSAPNDPYYSEQWNLAKIGAPAAWTKAKGTGILVGVVDTGVDLAHEDLVGKVVASTNCIAANDDPNLCHGNGQDDEGHGTHVSGIVAADTNNGIGVAGVAPDAQLVVAKALLKTGAGALNDVNAGIKWVVDHGAKVVNLSVEADNTSVTSAPGQSLAEGVDYAYSRGAIAVVAAGNSTPSLFGGDANAASVNALVVGATGPNDEVSFYSSPLAPFKWGLVAPGGDARGSDGKPQCGGALAAVCIVSTGWFPNHTNQYADDEGTSMAAPHVAGVLALLMGRGVGLSRDAAIQRLLATATKISCGSSCHGRLDAAAAVGVAVTPPAPSSTVTTITPTTAPPTTPPAHAGAAGPVPVTIAPARPAPTTTIPVLPSTTRPPAASALATPARGLPKLAGHSSSSPPTWLDAVAAVLLALVGLETGRRLRALRGGAAG